jgi:hypothetical protein
MTKGNFQRMLLMATGNDHHQLASSASLSPLISCLAFPGLAFPLLVKLDSLLDSQLHCLLPQDELPGLRPVGGLELNARAMMVSVLPLTSMHLLAMLTMLVAMMTLTTVTTVTLTLTLTLTVTLTLTLTVTLTSMYLLSLISYYWHQTQVATIQENHLLGNQ